MTTLIIPVDRVIRDREAWPRTALDPDRVAQFADLYLEAGAEALPPIQVLPDGEGGFVLADGWHRMEAICGLGWTELPAVVVEDSDDE
jgi:hypothetical protein